MKRPLVWAVSAVLAALVGFAVVGGPPPQAGTVVPQSQAGPLTMT